MSILALIPARGGSRGLPGKNIRPLYGHPLLGHSIMFAELCGVDRIVVSTDSPEIAQVARNYGAEVPGLRPARLAQHDTPIWPVIQHAVEIIPDRYDYLMLLEVPSPVREAGDFSGSLAKLEACPEADGVVTASRPYFESWAAITETPEGWVRNLHPSAYTYWQRQQVPPSYRYSGLYIWRTDYVLRHPGPVWLSGRHLLYETPSSRTYSIDTLEEFDLCQAMLDAGMIRLPWCQPPPGKTFHPGCGHPGNPASLRCRSCWGVFKRKPPLRLTCDVCGKVFLRTCRKAAHRHYFCSKACTGRWLGLTHFGELKGAGNEGD